MEEQRTEYVADERRACHDQGDASIGGSSIGACERHVGSPKRGYQNVKLK